VARAAEILRDEAPTNMITLRGFSRYPRIATMQEVYGLKPVALAVYPMYKGLARLVGMDVVDGLKNLDEQLAALEQAWPRYDFFFLHYKYTDSTGEDGNFMAKVKAIETLGRCGAANPRLENPMCSLSQAITAHRANCAATAGTQCPRCWWPILADRITSTPSVNRHVLQGGLGLFPGQTSDVAGAGSRPATNQVRSLK
jgi:hypothetical protein